MHFNWKVLVSTRDGGEGKYQRFIAYYTLIVFQITSNIIFMLVEKAKLHLWMEISINKMNKKKNYINKIKKKQHSHFNWSTFFDQLYTMILWNDWFIHCYQLTPFPSFKIWNHHNPLHNRNPHRPNLRYRQHGNRMHQYRCDKHQLMLPLNWCNESLVMHAM